LDERVREREEEEEEEETNEVVVLVKSVYTKPSIRGMAQKTHGKAPKQKKIVICEITCIPLKIQQGSQPN
jgi:hypothetical protein